MASMPEDDHAREYDNRHDDQADGKTLPAFLNVAFVLCDVKIFVFKLIHLGAYYTTYSHLFFGAKIRAFLEPKNDILRALLKGLN